MPIGFSPMILTERDSIGSFAKKLAFALCVLSLVASGAVAEKKKSEPVPGIDPDESLNRQLDEGKGVIDPPPVGDAEIQAPEPTPEPRHDTRDSASRDARRGSKHSVQAAGKFTVFIKA